MTMRSTHGVQCSCGHVGSIIMRENDAPFSGNWESYKPRNLNGEDFQTTEFITWDSVFKEMKLSCPKCGQALTPQNFTKD